MTRDDYLITVHDNVLRDCPSAPCGQSRRIYIELTGTGLIIACCQCSRILRRLTHTPGDWKDDA